jgi:transposase
MFGIGVSSFVRWKKTKGETGSAAATKTRGHTPTRVRPEDEALLRGLVASNNDWSIEELAVAFVTETGRSCSASSMGRTLRRLGLTRKKSR